MSSICVVCEKRPRVVNNVSNANNKTKRWVYPNVHRVRFSYPGSSKVLSGQVCTSCSRSTKINKVS